MLELGEILDLLKERGPMSERALVRRLGTARPEDVRAAVRMLFVNGFVRVNSENQLGLGRPIRSASLGRTKALQRQFQG